VKLSERSATGLSCCISEGFASGSVVINTAKKTGAFVVGTNLVGAITHGPWKGRIYGGNSVVAGRTGRTVAAAKDRDRDIMLVRL
jgi:hypothetical protein